MLRRTERSMTKVMGGVQLRDRQISNDLILMLGLNKTTDLLAMACNVHWYGHALWREDGPVLLRALCLEVERQKKKWRLKRAWKKQVEEESVKVDLRREDELYRCKWIIGVVVVTAGV